MQNACAINLGIGGAQGPSGGVLVQSLQRFGSAAKAGVQVGDEIIAANGQQVVSLEQWLVDLEAIGVGNTVAVRVLRGGQPVDLAMKLLEKKVLSLEVKALEQVLERKISP
ncbi:MAG TPA: PDZ domain-containing protein [Nannocystaceae bacterium]|nr:PDZ domain-containing protein [Nannocystaceae bacterium]